MPQSVYTQAEIDAKLAALPKPPDLSGYITKAQADTATSTMLDTVMKLNGDLVARISKLEQAAGTTPPVIIPPVIPPVDPPPATGTRLFGPSSLWNTVKSPTQFAAAADAKLKSVQYGLNNADYSHPTYFARVSDPTTTIVAGEGWGNPAQTFKVNAPAGMKSAPGGDGVLSILTTSGTLLDFYNCRGSGTSWTAQFYGLSDGVNGPGFGTYPGGVADPNAPGVWHGVGTTAIGCPQAAGTILARDVAAGVINHALFIAFGYQDEGGVGTSGSPSVLPAVANDAGGGPGPLPQGGLLTATGNMPTGLNTMEQALWSACWRYGVYICDRASDGWGFFYGDGSPTVGAAFGGGLNAIGRSLRLVQNW